MTTTEIIESLALPAQSLVGQRVPKKLVLENGGPTAADKRRINEGIDELTWVAALKPSNIGVPVFRDPAREYLEIAVLSLAVRPVVKGPRLIELVHRAIPYPLLLITGQGSTTAVSLSHKRLSEGGGDRIVLDGEILAVTLSNETAAKAEPAAERAFLNSMAVAKQPTRNLFALYQGWIDCVGALEAVRLTGSFVLKESADATSSRRVALADHSRLEEEILTLRTRAKKERQLNRRIEMNLRLKQLESQLAETRTNL